MLVFRRASTFCARDAQPGTGACNSKHDASALFHSTYVLSTIACVDSIVIVEWLPLEVPLNQKTEPNWEFLLSASRNSLQSFELSRLSHAANLRKEISQLLDNWLEENSSALLARWLMEQGERPACYEDKAERAPGNGARGKNDHSASDNFLVEQSTERPEVRGGT